VVFLFTLISQLILLLPYERNCQDIWNTRLSLNIQCEKSIDKIFIQKGFSGCLFLEWNRLLQKGNFSVSNVPPEKPNKLAKGNHPSGWFFYIYICRMKDTSKDTTTIFGIRAVIEAIQNEKTIDKIYIQKGLSGHLFQELQQHMSKGEYNLSYVPVEKLNRLVKGNHQGVVAKISPVKFAELEDVVEKALAKESAPLFLLLDQIDDVRNFGAIIRTAECCGVDAIIIQKKGGAPVTADTVKTSAGAIFNVPLVKVDHIKDAIYYMQASGIKVVAATEKTDDLLYSKDLSQPVALVMGNEGKGISGSVLKIVDEKAKLPLKGSIGSLNVSVACGAFLYEVVRQRL